MSDKSGRLILLVEDNCADADLAKCALQETGLPVDVHRVADGVGCLEYLAEGRSGGTAGDRLPNLILLDLNMPRMDGREVLRRLKAAERLKRIPVVVLSTSASRADVDGSYDLGANSYISKPMGYDEFVQTMQSLLSYWFSAVRLPA